MGVTTLCRNCIRCSSSRRRNVYLKYTISHLYATCPLRTNSLRLLKPSHCHLLYPCVSRLSMFAGHSPSAARTFVDLLAPQLPFTAHPPGAFRRQPHSLFYSVINIYGFIETAAKLELMRYSAFFPVRKQQAKPSGRGLLEQIDACSVGQQTAACIYSEWLSFVF